MPGPNRREHGAEPRGLEITKQNRSDEGRFGLMFKNLPAFTPDDALLKSLADIMTDSTGPSLDNPASPAGYTFFGQFIDHDLTLDETPLEAQRTDPSATFNFRTARFDLDSVYGQGPNTDTNSRVPYDPNDSAKLLIGGSSDPALADEDLPRDSNGFARIGDPRNEENLVIAQIQLAFLKFHNAMVDHVRTQGTPANKVFEEARQLTRWHYQWVVIHDFLPRIIGTAMLDQILEERPGKKPKTHIKYFKPKNPNKPMMPLEFAVAAYRFGHSMIRGGYRMNDQVNGIFFEDTPSNTNFNGFRPIPAVLDIDWKHFFEIPGTASAQPSRSIDARLAAPLFTLPTSVVPIPDDHTIDRINSLAHRNLLRGARVRLASGQAVAGAMNAEVRSNSDLGIAANAGWHDEAPLWYYILKESELQHQGKHLGDVGGRIIGEVFVGLLERDKDGYLRKDSGFTPAPPIAPAVGQFTMADLLAFANEIP